MFDANDVVAKFWAAANARDWDGFAAILSDDVVYEVPQTRERIRGRATYVQFNAEYPGDWLIEVQRIIGASGEAASWIEFAVGETTQTGITFFRLNDFGHIRSITDFWPEPYSPPPGREHLVERY